MPASDNRFKTAAVQVEPVFLNREAIASKVCSTTAEAGHNGTTLVVFLESFIPAYPVWV